MTTTIVRVTRKIRQTITQFHDVTVITDKDYPGPKDLAKNLVLARFAAGHDGSWHQMAPETDPNFGIDYNGVPKLECEIIDSSETIPAPALITTGDPNV